MEQNASTPDLSSFYNFAFRRDVRKLLAWGYEDSREKINSKREETEITGFIVEAIDNRLVAPQTPDEFDRYTVSEDKPIPSNSLTGKSRRRLDIVIENNLGKARLKYVFEAKRLFTVSHPIGKYTGSEGLQRFITGQYASQYPEAGMIGYVQNRTSDYWQEQLHDSFINDKSNTLHITAHLNKIEILLSLPNEWLSKHRRNDNSAIDIYHIFLDCT